MLKVVEYTYDQTSNDQLQVTKGFTLQQKGMLNFMQFAAGTRNEYVSVLSYDDTDQALLSVIFKDQVYK